MVIVRAPGACIALVAVALLSLPGSAAAHKEHRKPTQPAASAQAAAAPSGHAGMTVQEHASMAVTQPGAVAAEAAVPDAPPELPATFSGRLLDWLGRWHPSVVHFPIALFIVTALIEAAALALRKPSLAEGARVTLALAAVSALAAVALGWLNLGFDLRGDEPVERLHRWLGTVIAGLGLLAWWAKEALERKRLSALAVVYGVALGLTVAAVAVNGYLGGAIVHGADHMTF